MNFEIKKNMEHYELYVNGIFNSSYDTISEAVQAVEELKQAE